jgi:proteasome accessory factor A
MMNVAMNKLIGIEVELGNHFCQHRFREGTDGYCAASNLLCKAHKELFGIDSQNKVGCGAGLGEFGTHQFRFYLDHDHAEISSPLTADARDLVIWQRHVKQLAQCCQREVAKKSDQILIHCANTNRSGSAWGFHLNVLVSRHAFNKWRDGKWHPLFGQWVPFLVTSPILFGTGKVGTENNRLPADYQLSQRADFIDELVGLETVCSKSLINERDEPLADPSRYARFHISAAFDFNCCEFASWLKFGTVQIMLALIEAGADLPKLEFKDPLDALSTVSRDLGMCRQLELLDKSNCSAIDIQEQLAFSANRALDGGAIDENIVPSAKDIVNAWIITLIQLRKNDHMLRRRLDWIVKKYALDQLRGQLKTSWQDPRLRVLDFKYAEIDGGWFEMLEKKHMVDRLEDFMFINDRGARLNSSSRDIVRARILEKFGSSIVAVDWHYLCINVTQNCHPAIYKIDMEDPLNVTAIQNAVDGAHSPKEFVKRLPKNCYNHIECGKQNYSLF